MQSLGGKVAIVTGSSRGTGRSIALRLAADEARMVVNDQAEAEVVVGELRTLGTDGLAVRADVAHVGEIKDLMEKTVAEFGRLDILVSNMGVKHFETFCEVSEEEFDRTFAVNTRG